MKSCISEGSKTEGEGFKEAGEMSMMRSGVD